MALPKPIPKLGLYHYAHAAQNIAEAEGMSEGHALSLATDMARAILIGTLQVRTPETGMPLPLKQYQEYPSQYVTNDDVNSWLAKQGVPYRWTPAVVVVDSPMKIADDDNFYPREHADLNDPIATIETKANAEQTLADLFDPIRVPALEKMFPADGKWQVWAERAARNKLSHARTARGLFNPYLAARWFLQQGVTGWDWSRCKRHLTNNLPPRSIDEAYRLNGILE